MRPVDSSRSAGPRRRIAGGRCQGADFWPWRTTRRGRRPRRRRPHHGTAELASRTRRSERPRPHRAAALPGRKRAAPDRRSGRAAAGSRARLRAPQGPPRIRGVSSRRGHGDHGPQELRRDRARSSPRTGPERWTSSASPASSCSTRSTTAGCGTGSTAPTSTWPLVRPGPTTAGWWSSAPSTSACCRPATCRSPTSTVPARWRPRRSRWAQPRSRRLRVPAGPLAQPCRPGPGVGPARRGRHPDRLPRRRHRRPHRQHYFANGQPVPPDFHGGEENFRSVDYMGIPGPPAQTLATMIFDGVLERFPDLRFGVIEQGAIWVPSWIRQMESAFEAFARHEQRLRALSLRPSEYVRRQVRFTPYPTDDVGWIIGRPGQRSACSRRTFPMSKAGGARSSASNLDRGSRRPHSPSLLPRQLRRPDGLGGAGRRVSVLIRC